MDRYGAQLSNRQTTGAISFTENSLKNAVKYLLDNCYTELGNKIDPGPLFESPFRSSQEVFYKGDLRNFAKLTGKQLCQSLFF